MKFKMFKGFLLGVVLILAFSTLVYADDMNMGKGIEKKVDNVNVGLSFSKEKAKTGSNDIMVTLSDSGNQTISNAKVTATAEMDKGMNMDMQKSKPISIDFKDSDESGQYMGTVNFTDKGKWIVKVDINMQGQDKNVDFDVDVAGDGPSWGIIGGFLGVIALIIIVAAIKKKKPTKAR